MRSVHLVHTPLDQFHCSAINVLSGNLFTDVEDVASTVVRIDALTQVVDLTEARHAVDAGGVDVIGADFSAGVSEMLRARTARRVRSDRALVELAAAQGKGRVGRLLSTRRRVCWCRDGERRPWGDMGSRA